MRLYLITILLIIISFSCVKPPEKEVKPSLSPSDSAGIATYGKLVVLNEGLWHQNNATISQINLSDSSVVNGVYSTINNRELGDTGNDMQVYGDKLYAVIHSSSYVEVLDKFTLESLGRVELKQDGKARQPRYLAFYKDQVWVSCYDGYVVSFDTVSFTQNSVIKVGRNPEGLAVSGDKLFIANSGGLDTPNYDTTVSVIDLLEQKEVNKISVGINPHRVVAAFGKVYVSSRGNHNDVLSDTYVLDANTEKVIEQLGIESTSYALKEDTLIIASYNYNKGKSQVNYYDAITSSLLEEDALDLEDLKTLYGIYTASDGSIYCCDATGFTSSGKVYLFKNSIKPVKIVNVGLNPTNVVFVK